MSSSKNPKRERAAPGNHVKLAKERKGASLPKQFRLPAFIVSGCSVAFTIMVVSFADIVLKSKTLTKCSCS